jgi:hypothetical protein
MLSSRAAILTPSPSKSPSGCTITSPTWTPTRNSIRLSGSKSALRADTPRWTSRKQRTASTTLENSTRKPSPIVLTMWPRWVWIAGSISSARSARRRRIVPSSSAPVSREYPATSAARIAASLRSTCSNATRGFPAANYRSSGLYEENGEFAEILDLWSFASLALLLSFPSFCPQRSPSRMWRLRRRTKSVSNCSLWDRSQLLKIKLRHFRTVPRIACRLRARPGQSCRKLSSV